MSTATPTPRRSKMILTRRVSSFALRERLQSAPRPIPTPYLPSEDTGVEVETTTMSSPNVTMLGRRIPADTVPLDSILEPAEPVASFVFNRGSAPFGIRRRAGDPPSRYLTLRYGLVEPFSPGAHSCSNPRATGSLRGWYETAIRWEILSSDFRPALVLDHARRVRNPPKRLRAPPPPPPPDDAELDPSLPPRSTASTVRNPPPPEQVAPPMSPLLTYGRWDRALGRSPRVIAIGDVHGCIEELQELLRLADFQPGDQVVFLGDLVAKGPDSVSVVQLAREIGARAVRGNHDFEVVRWFEAFSRGDESTMVSLEHARIARALGKAEHAWLMECPWFIECVDMGHLFVHAGFIPGVKLTQQNPRLMMNMRSVLRDGTVTAKNVLDCEWAKLWRGPQTVVFGHDAFRGLQEYEFAKGIDTGCVYGGRLTALLLPENRLISVGARRSYVAPKRFRAVKAIY